MTDIDIDFNSDFLRVLQARGYLHQVTEPRPCDAHCAIQMMPGYVGFDATAPSLHVGNLVPVMGLAWLQRSGGAPVALVGGGTALVGDPSGKRSERPMLAPEQVAANAAANPSQIRMSPPSAGGDASTSSYAVEPMAVICWNPKWHRIIRKSILN